MAADDGLFVDEPKADDGFNYDEADHVEFEYEQLIISPHYHHHSPPNDHFENDHYHLCPYAHPAAQSESPSQVVERSVRQQWHQLHDDPLCRPD